ncbi:sugar porter family MFS transporter [Aristophania vespae]|uniref:Sugar porter family MFS transporter n=2 Tax=Aristophania vespae TaxID=2697033 RepID=A0A6P1NIT2_9PROT|nr:sugar porter family MFS transporter [Aristophania vespae]
MNTSALTIVIALVAATGGLLFGYDTGIISAALMQLMENFHLSTFNAEIVTSAIIVGALVGAISAGPISDAIGRRPSVLIAAVLFIIGTAAIIFANSMTSLVICRLILGLAIGAATQIVPIYIAEIAPPERRGSLVVAFQLAVGVGQLGSFILGFMIRNHSWRLMFGIGLVPALVLFIGMLCLPNSPRWMALKGRVMEARQVLVRLRSTKKEAEGELKEILAYGQGHEVDGKKGYAELFSRWVRPALIVGVGVALFCQITGINAVIYYAPTIFADVGFSQSSALLSVIPVGIAMVASIAFGGWAVDAWGRRKTMLYLLPGAIIGLLITGTMFHLGLANHGMGAWVTVFSVMAYTFFNVGSLSVGIWLIGAEVFPLSCRSQGMSLVSATHWSIDLLVSLTTLSMVKLLGAGGVFWLFAAMNFLAFCFVFYFVPETRGVSLEEIERRLRTGTFLSFKK